MMKIVALLFSLICQIKSIRIKIDKTNLNIDSSWESTIDNALETTKYYFKSHIHLPDQQQISITNTQCSSLAITPTTYTDADIIIYISSSSETSANYILWSDICEQLSNKRPIAARLHINSHLLSSYFKTTSSFHYQRLLDLFFREFFHILGANSKVLSLYPKLLTKAKEYYDCSTLTTIKLEQAPFGSGLNIHSPLLFQDVLTNYVGIEQVVHYVSVLSLALLDDTGYYTIDYDIPGTSWGKGKGCDFFQCSAAFDEFCDKDDCTYDHMSIGYCQYALDSDTCKVMWPQQQSPTYPNRKLTCTDDTNTYSWITSTSEQYTQSSRCFHSNYKTYTNDNFQRCYEISCTNGIPKVLDKSCDSESITIENSQIQCHNPCDNLFSNCNFNGKQQLDSCFCKLGKKGTYCDQDVVCNSVCLSCETESALKCLSCQNDYTLQEQSYCKQDASICPDNCSKCQDQIKCVVCADNFYLIEDTQYSDIGTCNNSVSIQNCTRYTSTTDCYECEDNYISSSNQCYQQIENCITQLNNTCSECKSTHHGSVNQDECILNIKYCLTYTANQIQCSQCQNGYINANDQCNKRIENCVRSNVDKCEECDQNHHLASSGCLINIQHCKTHEETDCTECNSDYALFNNKCITKISNCLEYLNETTCKTCESGYHSDISCYLNIDHCQKYNKNDCQECMESYQLFNNKCYKEIKYCIERYMLDVNLCGKCMNDAYTLSSDMKQCSQPIQNCDLANKVNNVIQCTQCLEGFHLLENKCQVDVENCLEHTLSECTKCKEEYELFTDKKCSKVSTIIAYCHIYDLEFNCHKCIGEYSLNQNQCFKMIQHCKRQSSDTKCQECETDFILFNQQKCYKQIENCLSYSEDLCSICQTHYILSEDKRVCLAPIENCILRQQQQPHECIECKDNYINNGQECDYCPIEFCKKCTEQEGMGKICEQCQEKFTPDARFTLCHTDCQLLHNLKYCLECPLEGNIHKCSSCSDGYYLQNGQCLACSDRYSHCKICKKDQCINCKTGYYYNQANQYCYPCSHQSQGCLLCDTKCTRCDEGYLLQESGQCVPCNQLISNCLYCHYSDSKKVVCKYCDSLSFLKENNLLPCIACPVQYPHCQKCTISQCQECQSGYYLQDSKCQLCSDQCVTCTSQDQCTSCKDGQLLSSSNTCTTDTTAIDLVNASSQQLFSYSLIKLAAINKKKVKLVQALDSKKYFCATDYECNMNGICLVSSCQCFDGIFGVNCQFAITDKQEIQQLQKTIITSLQTKNSLDLLQLLGETSEILSDEDAQLSYNIFLSHLAESDQNRLLKIQGLFARSFSKNQLLGASQLKKFDKLLNDILDNIAKTNLTVYQSQQIELPMQRIKLSKFDFYDKISSTSFNQTFSAITSDICNNEERITEPKLILTKEVIEKIKSAQSSASIPILSKIMHLYYNPYHNSEGQQLSSAVFRIEYLYDGQQIPIKNLEQSVQLKIPKLDQSFSDTSMNHTCLQWNKDKQIWDEDGVVQSSTIDCKFYVVCSVKHFSDFGFEMIPTKNETVSIVKGLKNIISTSFDFSNFFQNAAFAISMTIFLLFFAFLIALCILSKKDDTLRSLHRTRQQRIQTEGSQYQIPISSNPETERGAIKSPRMKKVNCWMVYPLYAIFKTETGVSMQIQKMSLWLLQIQVYTTLTALFLSIKPFSFGLLTIYYLSPIMISWFTNYIFGGIALGFRKKESIAIKIQCGYWFLYFLFLVGLGSVSIWRMYGLSLAMDLYLVAGVFIELVIDGIFCDLFVAYVYQTILEAGIKIRGCWCIVKYRGYFEIEY